VVANSSIFNDGSVLIGTAGSPATLDIGGSVTLVKGGAVTLGDNAGNAILSNGSTASLTNVRNTISGAGTIGDSHLSIINQASGLIEATGSSPLRVAAASLSNAGTLWANGGTLMVTSPVTGTGHDRIGSASTLEFGGSVATGEVASFLSNNGTLRLDNAESYHGTIAGFTRGNAIDLGDFSFAGNPTITSVSFVGSDTLVTVNDGAQSVTIDLFSASHSNNYILASDHRGANPGTLLAIA
jgi:hypothetical protein